jgi:hypothetical protein
MVPEYIRTKVPAIKGNNSNNRVMTPYDKLITPTDYTHVCVYSDGGFRLFRDAAGYSLPATELPSGGLIGATFTHTLESFVNISRFGSGNKNNNTTMILLLVVVLLALFYYLYTQGIIKLPNFTIKKQMTQFGKTINDFINQLN